MGQLGTWTMWKSKILKIEKRKQPFVSKMRNAVLTLMAAVKMPIFRCHLGLALQKHAIAMKRYFYSFFLPYYTLYTCSWFFPCQRWLATGKDDGQISRDLVPVDLSLKDKLSQKDAIRKEVALETKGKSEKHICIKVHQTYGEKRTKTWEQYPNEELVGVEL